MRAAPDLSEPQAFKIFSLHVMVYRTATFRQIFYKKLNQIQVFDFDINGQSGSDTFLPLPASEKLPIFTKNCRFHIPGTCLSRQRFCPANDTKLLVSRKTGI